MRHSPFKWMQTANGKRVNLEHDIGFSPNLTDIAVQLSHLNRYCGGTVRPYSVAEHSIFVSRLCQERYGVDEALWGLLHDAHEMITGDIPSPVKRILDSDALRDLENDIDFRIARKFDLEELVRDDGVKDNVRKMDLVALMTEHRDLQVSAGDWGVHVEPCPVTYVSTKAVVPSDVAVEFIHRFHELKMEYEHKKSAVHSEMNNPHGKRYRYFYEENATTPSSTADLEAKLKQEKKANG